MLFEIVDVGPDVLADVPSEGSWFHVTHERFDRFDLNAEPNTFDWNTGLGIHFSRDGDGARECFGTWKPTCRVIEATLRIASPARYESEHDLDFHALRLLKADGLTLDDVDLSGAILFEEERENLCHWFDDYDPDCVLYDDGLIRWSRDLVIASHREPEIRERASQLVKADLTAAGYDGIVYGNEIDFPCVSAVVFETAQITIVNPAWKSE